MYGLGYLGSSKYFLQVQNPYACFQIRCSERNILSFSWLQAVLLDVFSVYSDLPNARACLPMVDQISVMTDN